VQTDDITSDEVKIEDVFPELTLPTQGEEESAEPAGPTNAEPPKQGLLKLTCPNCKASGLIPWGSLSKLLCCSGCRTWYKAGTMGQLLAVPAPAGAERGTLRAYFADGRERTVPVPTAPPAKPPWWEGRHGGAAIAVVVFIFGRRWVALLTLLVLIGGGTLLIVRHQAGKPPPLPTGLEARAGLFVEAWLSRDHAILNRLTDPALDRRLRRWLADHPPQSSPIEFKKRDKAFQTRVLKQDDRMARVEVRVSVPDRVEPILFEGDWTARAGTWFFVPPAPTAQPVAEGPTPPSP
jgi:hypothetical protein